MEPVQREMARMTTDLEITYQGNKDNKRVWPQNTKREKWAVPCLKGRHVRRDRLVVCWAVGRWTVGALERQIYIHDWKEFSNNSNFSIVEKVV